MIQKQRAWGVILCLPPVGLVTPDQGITGVCPSPPPALTLSFSVRDCNVVEGCAQTQSEDRSVLFSLICSEQTLFSSRARGESGSFVRCCFFPFLSFFHQPRVKALVLLSGVRGGVLASGDVLQSPCNSLRISSFLPACLRLCVGKSSGAH